MARSNMFELARRDVTVPLNVQLGALKDLVSEVKFDGIGLTEVSAEAISGAAKLVNISAVEVKLSFGCKDPLHNVILDTCARLDIPVKA